MKAPRTILLSAILISAPLSVPAESSGWEPSLDLRVRYENVQDDRFHRDNNALTARLRAGLTSPEWSGWRFGITGHANQHIGSERFNSTANGRTDYPVVADPTDEGISQAWVGYRAGDRLEAKIGRQRLTEDNLRFLGNVGFRQLEQTFDAVSLGWQPDQNWRIDLRWLDRAHRIFGPDHPNPLNAEFDLNAWMGTASRSFGGITAAVYAHRLAFNDRPASHRNLGARINGPVPGDHGLSYRLEFARQDGLRELDDVSGQNYIYLRINQQLASWRWFAGHERLEGDGEYAFQTPLATLHAHNGWSDQFLAIPPDGLIDTHAGAGTGLGEWTGLFKIHHFESDRNSRRYGNEYGLMLQRPLPAGLTFQAKAAWFDGGHDRAYVSKIWLTITGNW